MECMARIGSPTSIEIIPSPVDAIGPIVDPPWLVVSIVEFLYL